MTQGFYSLYSLEAARLNFILIVSLWNLTCISEAELPVTYQSDVKSQNPYIAASSLHEILL